MSDIEIKRALIAVYDKTGIADFARALVEEFGIEIISTGGTARHLQDAGIPVTLVEEVTGFPEMLDGRVKTLHPKIHAAILADRDNPEHMRQLEEHGIRPIDMVVANLYPFEETIEKPNCSFEDAIEMIDIGGPCLLRAAAKNHRHVAILTMPRHYVEMLCYLRHEKDYDQASHKASLAERAWEVYWMTGGYDGAVASWLANRKEIEPYTMKLRLLQLEESGHDDLRYGENPHQSAMLYDIAGLSPESGTIVRGSGSCTTSLSFNNHVDANAALALCAELSRATATAWHPSVTSGIRANAAYDATPSAVFIKHTNACGVAVAGDQVEAYRQAYLGDPRAAMGGILAVNFEVTPEFATAVMESLQQWGKPAGAGAFFVEVWVASAFADDAIETIRTTKKWGERVRLLAVGDMTEPPDPNELDFKHIAAGMLVQQRDLVGLNEDQWKVVTERKPTDAEMADLRLAWLVCKHTKSNAITTCNNGMLIGNGAGQMSRIMSCRIATWLAQENGHAEKLAGSVAASDAFFPFRDGLDILADAGVTTVIQPGGSKRDQEVIAAANERGVAMVFTGTRHFRH